jgi:hypothetical protein
MILRMLVLRRAARRPADPRVLDLLTESWAAFDAGDGRAASRALGRSQRLDPLTTSLVSRAIWFGTAPHPVREPLRLGRLRRRHEGPDGPLRRPIPSRPHDERCGTQRSSQ